MKVKLVFDDWRDRGTNKSIYNTADGIMLSSGKLHSGSTFAANIDLDAENAEFLRQVLDGGEHVPVFYIIAARQGININTKKEK